MRDMANAGAGSAATFARAYRFDPRRGGWHDTEWGESQVTGLCYKHALAGDCHGLTAAVRFAAAEAAGTAHN